jgi:hypothetical protein
MRLASSYYDFRFLRKHLSAVDRFYRQISDVPLQSETAIKVMERLEMNRDKLFTFLIFDGVPWNNNNAEHAVNLPRSGGSSRESLRKKASATTLSS